VPCLFRPNVAPNKQNSPGVSSAASTCWSFMLAILETFLNFMPNASLLASRTAALSSNKNKAACSPRSAAAIAYWTAMVYFPRASRTQEKCAGPPLWTAAQERVECRDTTLDASLFERLAVFGCHQQATSFDVGVVVTSPEVGTSKLNDAEPAAGGTVQGGELFKRDDAMCDSTKLKARLVGGAIVDQQNGASPTSSPSSTHR
jgi:hypothetical protein